MIGSTTKGSFKKYVDRAGGGVLKIQIKTNRGRGGGGQAYLYVCAVKKIA